MSNQGPSSIHHRKKGTVVKNDAETWIDSHFPPVNEGGKTVKTKRKTRGARQWMRFDMNGETEVMECDKSTITKLVSVPARDLRIPGLIFSNSFSILVREKSIIVNLDNIKAIVTANEVLLLDSLRPQVLSLIGQLKRNVPENVQSCQDQEAKLPFEFQVLESALEVVGSCFDTNVGSLEAETLPVLAELTKQVTAENPAYVRSLKSNLTRLLAGVQKMKDVIEHLLDDDKDMADIYLTRKCNKIQQDGVEDLEMLLEAYLIQAEVTRNKIHAIRKYIDDTEAYLKIHQNDKRNELLMFEQTLKIGAFAISAGTLLVSLFGMNKPVPLYNINGIFGYFAWGSVGLCIVVFMATYGYARWKKLID